MSERTSPSLTLSHCLVEGDEGAVRRARNLRRKALLISVVVQLALLAALLVMPLVATSERLTVRAYIPRTPYGGAPRGISDHTDRVGLGKAHKTKWPLGTILYRPVRIPPAISPGNIGSAAPDIGNAPLGAGNRSEIGEPAGILDQSRAARPVEPPRPSPVAPPRLRVSVIDPSALIYRVEPKYPTLAKQIGLQGEVRLRAIIGTDGTVQHLEILSGHALFIEETRKALAQWRYRPTRLNGQPVEVETLIIVRFQLAR